MTEALANVRLVKAFDRESHEDRRVATGLDRVFGLTMRAAKVEGLMGAVGGYGMMLMMVSVLWYGGTRPRDPRLLPPRTWAPSSSRWSSSSAR